jgi:cytochrome c oxidase assembly protein subunit 15
MTTDAKIKRVLPSGWHRYLLLTATILTYLLVTIGGIVCVTDSSQGCPDWPACYGQVVPPMRLDSILEYIHRVLAGLTLLFIIASAIVGWYKVRTLRWVSRPPVLAVVFLLAASAFGAMVVLRGLEPGLAALDLGLALLVLALMLASTVVAFSYHHNPELTGRLSFRGPYARLTLWTLVAVLLVMVSAVLVADNGSVGRCLGWPVASGRLLRGDLRGWLQMARFLVAGVADILIVAVAVQAWRTQRARTTIVSTATLVGMLFLAEIVVGVLLAVIGSAISLLVIHAALAAALWALLVMLVLLAGLAPLTSTDER